MKPSFSRARAVVGLLALGGAIAILSGGSALAADDSTYKAARELADKIQSMTQGGGGATGVKAATEPLPKVDPCSLLTGAEVRQYFPKAKAPVRERDREKYGITACIWDHPAGRLVLQLTLGAEPGSSNDEAQGLVLGFVDPLKPGVREQVRIEKIDGVGSEAAAVVEKADEKRGILSDAAYLYTQRGDVQLLVAAVDLARGDRSAALNTLREIGRIAAGRL